MALKKVEHILVGIDLSRADRLVASDITEDNRHVLDKAIWLARHTGAKITFLSALDLSAHTQRLIQEDPQNYSDVDDTAMGLLSEFVKLAEQEQVVADARLAYGSSWYELICEVLRSGQDLVIVGTRDRSSVKRFLLGSTGMKLLRYCPCPVWVTKPTMDTDTTSILAATDLSPVGETAMRAAARIAKAENADLHIVHAVEYPLERPLRLSQAPPDDIAQYRKGVRKAAEETLQKQLECPDVTELRVPPEVHLSDDLPDSAISAAIEEYNIDLVVMGTVARGGLQQFLIGNTAERILPELSCSVLAVKPDDFDCPIKLED